MKLLMNVKYMGSRQPREPLPEIYMNYKSAFITETKCLYAKADEDGDVISSFKLHRMCRLGWKMAQRMDT